MQTTITSPATLSGLCLENYAPVEALSEETIAFSATVYDVEAGAPIGTLINDGHGGCHRFRPAGCGGMPGPGGPGLAGPFRRAARGVLTGFGCGVDRYHGGLPSIPIGRGPAHTVCAGPRVSSGQGSE